MNAKLGRWPLLLTMVLAVLLSILLLFLVTAPRTEAQNQDNSQEDANTALAKLEVLDDPGEGTPGPLSAAQKKAVFEQGYLVPDQSAYDQAKNEAAAKAEQPSSEKSSLSVGTQAPQTTSGSEGVFSTCCGPSDSTGAVGTSRYIELVNVNFGIYDTTDLGTPLNTGSLNDLVPGDTSSHSIFDPQIIWDPDTQRFFYVVDDVVSATENRLAFGFSKTDSPSSAADFCKYSISFESRFLDYPKLGDTQDLLLIGANAFDTNDSFLGADLNSITKPPAGSNCPDKSTFTTSTTQNLKTGDGTTRAFTPVPANQIDTNGTGYVVARPVSLPATKLSIYQVTKNANGTANVSAAHDLTVPSYTVPANAAQKDTKKSLDTSDARNTQAVSAIDPSQLPSGALALWTQHTVFGGKGAEVRWYEINPDVGAGVPLLLQSGTVTDPSKYIFNGAISPDRKVDGSTTAFGDSMVLGFNSSAKDKFPDIRMVSKTGTGAQSSPVLVKKSNHSLNDFTCSPQPCRWGDYAAATPDPSASATGTNGRVWLTSQYVRTGKGSGARWGSFNWVATL